MCSSTGVRDAIADSMAKTHSRDTDMTREIILKTFTTFYGGMSLGSIQNAFEELGIGHIAKSTLWEWLIEFTNQVIPYAKSFKPKVGDYWYADEIVRMR